MSEFLKYKEASYSKVVTAQTILGDMLELSKPEDLSRMLNVDYSYLLVEEDEVLGLGTLDPREDSGAIYIDLLVIEKTRRRQGNGKHILGFLEVVASQISTQKVTEIRVLPFSDEAKIFYEKYKYTQSKTPDIYVKYIEKLET